MAKWKTKNNTHKHTQNICNYKKKLKLFHQLFGRNKTIQTTSFQTNHFVLEPHKSKSFSHSQNVHQSISLQLNQTKYYRLILFKQNIAVIMAKMNSKILTIFTLIKCNTIDIHHFTRSESEVINFTVTMVTFIRYTWDFNANFEFLELKMYTSCETSTKCSHLKPVLSVQSTSDLMKQYWIRINVSACSAFIQYFSIRFIFFLIFVKQKWFPLYKLFSFSFRSIPLVRHPNNICKCF